MLLFWLNTTPAEDVLFQKLLKSHCECWVSVLTECVLVTGSCPSKVETAVALHGCSCDNFEPLAQTLSKQSSAELRNFLWHLPADSYLKFSCTKNMRCAALHLSRGRLLHPCRAEMHLRATNPIILRASLELSKAKISLPSENSARELTWPRIRQCLLPLHSPDLTPWGSIKDKVYETTPHILEELTDTVHIEISAISEEELQRVNVFRSCAKCIRSGRQNFQHLLWHWRVSVRLSKG